MNSLQKFMKATYDWNKDLPVRVVAIPIPPAPIDGLIILPQAFSSRSYDLDNFGYTGGKMRLITSYFSDELGPVILLSTTLGELVGNAKDGLVYPMRSTFCAGVSYYRTEIDGEVYADQVTINSMQMIGRSCNPGSHYVVPHAPCLTALLQFAQSPTDKEEYRIETFNEQFAYLSPAEGAALFPTCNWQCNDVAEEYVSQCAAKIRFYRTYGGVGAWSQPYMRQMFINRFLPKEEYR